MSRTVARLTWSWLKRRCLSISRRPTWPATPAAPGHETPSHVRSSRPSTNKDSPDTPSLPDMLVFRLRCAHYILCIHTIKICFAVACCLPVFCSKNQSPTSTQPSIFSVRNQVCLTGVKWARAPVADNTVWSWSVAMKCHEQPYTHL